MMHLRSKLPLSRPITLTLHRNASSVAASFFPGVEKPINKSTTPQTLLNSIIEKKRALPGRSRIRNSEYYHLARSLRLSPSSPTHLSTLNNLLNLLPPQSTLSKTEFNRGCRENAKGDGSFTLLPPPSTSPLTPSLVSNIISTHLNSSSSPISTAVTFMTPGGEEGRKVIDLGIRRSLLALGRAGTVTSSTSKEIIHSVYKSLTTFTSSPYGPWSGKGISTGVSRKIERRVISKVKSDPSLTFVLPGVEEDGGLEVRKVDVLEGLMMGYFGRRIVDKAVEGTFERTQVLGRIGTEKDLEYYRGCFRKVDEVDGGGGVGKEGWSSVVEVAEGLGWKGEDCLEWPWDDEIEEVGEGEESSEEKNEENGKEEK